MVSVNHMLISMLSVLLETHDIWCAEVAETLVLQVQDLNPAACSAPCIECAISGIQTCPISSSDIPSSLSGLSSFAITCPL